MSAERMWQGLLVPPGVFPDPAFLNALIVKHLIADHSEVGMVHHLEWNEQQGCRATNVEKLV